MIRSFPNEKWTESYNCRTARNDELQAVTAQRLHLFVYLPIGSFGGKHHQIISRDNFRLSVRHQIRFSPVNPRDQQPMPFTRTPIKATLTGVTPLSSTSTSLTWNQVPGAVGYAVYRSSTLSGSYYRIANISGGTTLSATVGAISGSMDRKIDDHEALDALEKGFAGKEVLLIAPGKSIDAYHSEIQAVSSHEDVITVSVNFLPQEFAVNYAFYNNLRRYEHSVDLDRERLADSAQIVTSNLPGNILVGKPIQLNFDTLAKRGWKNYDNSMSVELSRLRSDGLLDFSRNHFVLKRADN